MCGIVGRFDFKGNPVAESLLRRMCALTAHRGPDDEGVYLHGPVGLGSRRLSIIDVAGGHQPISNEDGSIWLVFNGEIYNFQELHDELERKGHRFDTRTDTEVIVHLYEEMGEACVQRLNGMFAFAIWDARRRRLVLARDRLGKKPLHYAVTRGGIVFASEVAPILEDPEVPRRINLLALHQYLHLAYVPGPLTIFQDVMKLPPAHLMVVENEKMIVRRYWDVDFGDKRALTPAVWADEVMALLQEAVRIRMVADVPLGAMLSGGIDSSLVVALMTRYSSLPVKTFSIGFQDTDYNELPHARRVAEHLGTEHYEEVVCPDAASVLPKLVWHYGEPFGDESCIPTYYLSRLARRQVTVALSGDGGDESFGGYPRLPQYVSFSAANSLRGLLSSEIRDIAHDAHPLAAALSPRRWSAFGKELVFRLDEITHPMERYSHAWTVWKECSGMPLMPQAQAGVARQRVFGALEDGWQRTRGWDPLDRLLYLDLQTYLPDDLQVKMDIASMAASLEVRSPLLDYRLVELAARMPSSLKFEGGQTKVLLRSLAGTLMPPGITNRGKWGFSVPIGRWLRHDLRPMMEDLLLDATCRQRGIFDPPRVQRMVSEHLGGLRDNGRYLWLLLVFELWARVFLDCHRDVPLQPSWTASHV